jgi:hypothetical protein
VVSYLISGMTKIMWDLLPTFLDPMPLTFQLQVGTTDSNDADDWQDVGLPMQDVYFAFDPEQRVWGKTNWTHYRVKLTSSLGVYYSDPVAGMGILDRRYWRIAREMIRQRKKAYYFGPGGQAGYLLKRRVTGKPCPICLDYQTGEVKNPDCPNCFGTGFDCGYFFPQSCIWAEISPRAVHLQVDPNMRGTVADMVVQADMIMTELLAEEDVWVGAKTDDRYYVHMVTNTAEIKGVPLVAAVELRLIPFSSIIYTIAIPQQLQMLGLEA